MTTASLTSRDRELHEAIRRRNAGIPLSPAQRRLMRRRGLDPDNGSYRERATKEGWERIHARLALGRRKLDALAAAEWAEWVNVHHA